MGNKPSIFALYPALPTDGTTAAREDRRPTDAERAYVRAKARQAALAMFEAEQQRGKDEAPCE
jgi:hypothetical protein